MGLMRPGGGGPCAPVAVACAPLEAGVCGPAASGSMSRRIWQWWGLVVTSAAQIRGSGDSGDSTRAGPHRQRIRPVWASPAMGHTRAPMTAADAWNQLPAAR